MRMPWRDRQGRLIVIKAVVSALICVPAAVLSLQWGVGTLGSRPVTEVIHGTGLWTVRFLLLSLAITPARLLFDWPRLVLVRRMVGLTALAYGVAHLALYALDQQFVLATVVSEIVHRAYLTIGFVALLGLAVLGATSFDAAIRRMRRWWKRLHRLAYGIAVLAILHYFIQSKADVSEPVFVAGLSVWLMLWRATPTRWQRGLPALLALAPLVALATALIECLWYAATTRIDPLRVLLANLSLGHGLRPAQLVLMVVLAAPLLVALRRVFWRWRLAAGQARALSSTRWSR